MKDRNDAVLAGAEFALAVEDAALRAGSEDTVGTTGAFFVEPGLENSIGRIARVSLDARDTVQKRRDAVMSAAKEAAARIASKRGVRATFTTRSSDIPTSSHPSIVEAVAGSAEKLGYGYKKLVSRAYHDSLLMAHIFPVGMIFIPCRGGVSHHPSEFSTEAQMEKGVRTLALTLAELAGGEWESRSSEHTEL